MKKLLVIIAVFAFLSCKDDKQKEDFSAGQTEVSEGAAANMTASQKLGQEIFNGKGNCYTCHKQEQKAIGPSLQVIAKAYKAKGGDMAAFLREKAEPIVDPSQYATMKTNFYITKHFTDEEMQAVVDYVMSFQ
ncbi:c-type cytochrome [Flavobacterium coralii]|uniref:c-type cytochrome n=1 Tax=Flavobacterium coralii TaxID=2838017 RepID=UPI000C42BD23|nr:cytochrome C552 [Flavobacterium sp.]|tara:strand:- start:63039 stop:63437 length:399 start_codon:yes stop_codon:yes gene_type:complete